MKKILFISHDASLSGAPVMLLRLIRILKGEGFYIKIILKSGSGELVDQFNEIADEIFIYYAYKKGLLNKVRRKLTSLNHENRFKKILRNTDVLISNTITNGSVLEHLVRYYKGPVITYVHELEMGAKYFTTREQIEMVLKVSNHFLVSSEAVRNYLTGYHNILKSKITKLNYYISQDEQTVNQDTPVNTNYALKKRFIVGTLATTDWRKSPDLFVLVAKFFFEKKPEADVQFIWKGFVENSVTKDRLQYDIKKLHLEQKVILEDASFETASFYRKVDLFLLTSREDPYPLVVLEAASYKKPTVCFKDTGGASEFIEDNAGTVVPYLSIEEMADIIADYYDDPQKLLRQGDVAYEKVKKLHCDAKLVLEQFKKIIEHL